ncbi:MAG: nitrogenase component 1 [Pseudomonadota bacterium]
MTAPRFRPTWHDISPYLDGVYLAVNALPDTYLVYDAHSCGYQKAEKIAGNHDLLSDLVRWDRMNRVVRTDLDSREYVMGSDDKLSKKILQVWRRYAPAAILVVRSPVVITQGHDARPVLTDLAQKIDAPLLLVPDKQRMPDHLAGYLSAQEQILGAVELRGAPVPRSVAIVGHLFDRHEGDQRGNAAELRRLVTLAGGVPGALFLDGRPFAAYGDEAPPTVVVDLGTSWHGGEDLAARYGACHLPLPLPLGIEGTTAWVRSVAAALGAEPMDLETSEVGPLVRDLEWILPRLFGTRAMVFADHQLLGPLVEFLREVGVRVTAIGSTTGPGRVPSAGPLAEIPRPPAETDALTASVTAARRCGDLDLVIGNGFLRQLVHPAGVPFLELGYPSPTHHALHDAPFLGYVGVRVLVERVLNALAAAPREV